MNPPLNLPTFFSTHRFLKGMLVEGKDGQVVLKTNQGAIPVQLEGNLPPLGRELIFQVIREEPGKIVLSPYKMESIPEKLPFLRDLFGNNLQAAFEVLQALTNENLPLTREVFADIKRWMLTAEKVWGLKVDPRVFAFLRAKGLPVTPQTVFWTMYALFPSVQQELWRMTEEGQELARHWLAVWRGKKNTDLPTDPAVRPEVLTCEVADRIDKFLTGLPGLVKKHALSSASEKGEKETALRQAIAFLEAMASEEISLPHFVFYLFSEDGMPQVRWEGRGSQAGKTGSTGDFSFRLIYQSAILGEVEITAVKNQAGLQLKVRTENSLAFKQFPTLRSYLEQKGWLVSQFTVEPGPENGRQECFIPLQVEGWL